MTRWTTFFLSLLGNERSHSPTHPSTEPVAEDTSESFLAPLSSHTPIAKPSHPLLMLAAIPVFATLTPHARLIWIRSILLQTRGVHNPQLAPLMDQVTRHLRRTLIYAQHLRFSRSYFDRAQHIEEQLASIITDMLHMIPPGKPSFHQDLTKNLTKMKQLCIHLRSVKP